MSDHPEPIHKTISTFGPINLAFTDKEEDESHESKPQSVFRTLVHPFVIKQWLHQGKLYRERKERIPSRFELFFDLVFVAIAHQLSETAAEHAGGIGLAQFILTFYPTWSLWNESRAFLNASGTDDILQRVGILFLMALLVGYTANATAISIAYPNSEFHSTTESTTTEETTHALTASILAVAEEGVSAVRRDPALVTATVFYLIGRAFRVVFFFMYAVALPKFRKALLIQSMHQIIGFIFYFPLLFVRSTKAIVALAIIGMVWDIFMRYTIFIWRLISPDYRRHTTTQVKLEKAPERSDTIDGDEDIAVQNAELGAAFDQERSAKVVSDHVPALNIEHFLERTAAFVVIVLGEMVLSVVYHATDSQIGFKNIYGNAICGLMIAFNFCWLYFDSECSRRFVHALRRHWFTGVSFTALHFPLCSALIIASAAISQMTKNGNEQLSMELRWYFGGGLGCAMIVMATIGLLHRGLDPAGTTRLSRVSQVQLGMRMAVGITMVCLPLAKNLNSLDMMGVCAGLTSLLVIEETYGKLQVYQPTPISDKGQDTDESATNNIAAVMEVPKDEPSTSKDKEDGSKLKTQ
ncbi:hypothetical protein CPB86DRAFT_778353 [Serendipita vermifera]|nr:hypothetical protein CPB86DRAFT_778353 [Serendipita vermifera]